MRFFRLKHRFFLFFCTFCLAIQNISFLSAENIPALTVSGSASEVIPPDASQLFSLSACLMDAESGRILYSKEADVCRPNASTTKILTCILALEYGNLDALVTVSDYAASMPDVQLNMQSGEQYRLGDLLYSLMLESHNDTAVAIAEHISGSVEAFAALMNEKANDIGCCDSHFITPNGLDATETIANETVFHGATAADLCRILAYCIKNEEFLKITQTSSYQFSNYECGDDGNVVPGGKSFTVTNRNAFLTMMEGVISGKTGFTGDAGYCYVTALQQDNRTFTVALLGCGWPNNKTYKWKDSRTLLEYGLNAFYKTDLFRYEDSYPNLPVHNGVNKNPGKNNASENVTVPLTIAASPLKLLVKKNDLLSVDYNYFTPLEAPIEKGTLLGTATYKLNNETIHKYNLYAAESIEEYNFSYCLSSAIQKFFLN